MVSARARVAGEAGEAGEEGRRDDEGLSLAVAEESVKNTNNVQKLLLSRYARRFTAGQRARALAQDLET